MHMPAVTCDLLRGGRSRVAMLVGASIATVTLMACVQLLPPSSRASLRRRTSSLVSLACAPVHWLLWLLPRQLRARDAAAAAAMTTSDAATQPRSATQAALRVIRAGRVTTLGGLVYFLRGPPHAPFVTSSNNNNNNNKTMTTVAKSASDSKVHNEHRLGVPFVLVQFLQESYLPATRNNNNDNKNNNNNDSAMTRRDSCARIERAMFEQLVHASHALRRLEVERATAFDESNYSHVNLLQQLWAASGRPANSYVRTSPLWTQLGFQGSDPTTDLRGGGVFALRQFLDFAQTHTTALRAAMAYNKRVQDAGADTWYMTAVVSIQLSAQLLLQREFALSRPHLEVLYDMVHVPTDVVASNNNNSSSSSNSSSTTSKTAVVTRDELARRVYGTTLTACHCRTGDDDKKKQKQTKKQQKQQNDKDDDDDDDEAAAALARVWAQPCDVEAGLNALHHALLLHFMRCWERDTPHVMSYNTYIAENVFATFFTPTWSLSTSTTATAAATS